ncbi:MAG: hypothetical protein ACE5IR_07695 [bacterium]
MKTKSFLILLSLIVILVRAGSAQQDDIDNALAYQYFQEALTISQRDNAQLWGVELYGPMLFVNPRNRTITANQSDEVGYLKREGSIYVGELPKEENIANTAFAWGWI